MSRNHRRYNDDDQFVLGANTGNGNSNDVETIFYPEETIVNTTTNNRTIRRVRPIHIRNVNKNITRIENYYPVTESVEDVNLTSNKDMVNIYYF